MTTPIQHDNAHSHLEKSIADAARDNAKAVCDSTAALTSVGTANTNAIRDQMVVLDTHNNTVFDRNFGENRSGQRQITEELARLSKQNCEEVLRVDRHVSESTGVINANIASAVASIERQACEYKADSQLEALKNKEALAKQIAECCCSIKTLATQQHCDIKTQIEARANQTDLLLRETEANRVRDDLNQARTEILLNKIKKTCE